MTFEDIEKLNENSPIVKAFKKKIEAGEFGSPDHLNYEKMLKEIEMNWTNEEN